jgi:hypothetical protein
VNVDMAPEFAKELVWEKRDVAIGCQPYIFGKQYFRLHRLKEAGLDVVVTDSPLLLSVLYGAKSLPGNFRYGIAQLADNFDNHNFFVERCKPYDPRGRLQNEEEARVIDRDIKRLVGNCTRIPGNPIGACIVTDYVLSRL